MLQYGEPCCPVHNGSLVIYSFGIPCPDPEAAFETGECVSILLKSRASHGQLMPLDRRRSTVCAILFGAFRHWSGFPVFRCLRLGQFIFFGVSRFSIPLHNTGKDSGMRKKSDSCAGVFILLIRSVDLQDFEIAGGDIGTGWKGLSCFEINSVFLPGFRLQRMRGRVEQDQELFFRIVFPVKSGT